MRPSTALTVAALGLSALALQAQAAPITYDFDAVATGTLNGPISGTFTFDLANVWNTYDFTATNGDVSFVQYEEPDGGYGLVDWTLPDAHRTTGSIWGATVSRTKLASGGSTLTLATSAAFSRGAFGEQTFSITYTSDTDILYTQRDPFLALDGITSATGSYKHYYGLFGTTYIDKAFTFTVTNTAAAVPEPSVLALLLAGVGVSLGVRRMGIARRRTV